jgi:hypothetical protein
MTKEQPLLLARFSSRSPSDGQAPVFPGNPHHGELELPRSRWWWWGGGGGRGHGREGRQGLLVVAPLRASAFPRCGRRHLWRLGFLPAPLRATGPTLLWGSITSDGGTAKRGHGWAVLRGEG